MLAVQGGFAAHVEHLRRAGADPVEVRTPAGLEGLDGLILPGGESSTIRMGIAASGLEEGILTHHRQGRPVLGTCAGMIVSGREHLGLIDITTRRNAFGRQLASFEAEIGISGVLEEDFTAVFIRAPWVEKAGEEVEVLSRVEGHPVAVRQANVTAFSFHPELTSDERLHRWFVAICAA